MGFPEINFTEPMRQKTALLMCIIHVLGLLLSLMLVGIGVYIKIAIEDKLSLTDNYNNDVLPYMMICLGVINFVIYVAGGFLCILTKTVSRRRSVQVLLLPYVCVSLLAAICVFSSAMMSLAHVGHLHHSFGNGLVEAMKQYKINPAIKVEIDHMQMQYGCCGAHGYTDWFRISWIANNFLDVESENVQSRMIRDEYFNDDAPFSCCDPAAMRPCIHHRVTHDSAHFVYSHAEKNTLYAQGCRDALMDYFSKVLYESSIVIIVIFCVQIVIILGMRFLQTTVCEAIARGDMEGDAPGWLFGLCAAAPEVDSGGKEDRSHHVPLLSGDYSSASSNEMYVSPVKKGSSGGRRSSRGSETARMSRHDDIYENIDPPRRSSVAAPRPQYNNQDINDDFTE